MSACRSTAWTGCISTLTCPILQVGGQVVLFPDRAPGQPGPLADAVPSIWATGSAGTWTASPRQLVSRCCAFKKPDRSRWDDRKLDHVRPYLDQAAADGRFGVVAIVVAQEFQWVTGRVTARQSQGWSVYDFVKEERRVSAYYFYVHDREFGAGFIKICSYFPYPAKVWLNGHEWAKRQARREGLSYASLANGFAACPLTCPATGDLRPFRARPTRRRSSTGGPR